MSKSSSGTGCLILFSLPFAGVGVFMLYLIGSQFWHAARMSDWPTVPATLLEAELEVNRSSDSSTERAVARYRYEWNGREHEGDRVAIGRSSDNIGSFHERKANTLKHALRNGRTVDVHVNPKQPSQSILYPEIRWEMVAFQGLFGVVFGGVGFGMLIGGFRHRKNTQAQKTLEESRPGEPWTWKPEWAAGEITSGGKTGAIVVTAFAAFWNLVSLPVLFAFPTEFFDKGNKAMAIALIFPVIGFFMILTAVYLWLRVRKYGGCSLVLQQIPGVIGGRLSGAIRIPQGLEAPDGVELTLRNVRKVTTGSGKHRSTREHELWSGSRHLSTWRTGPTGEVLLPVRFEIPYSCEAVDESDSYNKVIWTLKAGARTPGVDFGADFEVPVFKTPDSDPDFVAPDDPGVEWNQPEVRERLWAEEHIRLETGPVGATRMVFPMMRHKGYGISMLLFTLIWCGVTFAIARYTDAPLLFPIVFGFFALLLITGTVHVCFSRQVLDLRPGQLEARGGLFGLSGPHTFTREQLTTLQTHSNSSSGNTQYYNIRIQDARGKNRTLAGTIKGKTHADRILAYIREQCGSPA